MPSSMLSNPPLVPSLEPTYSICASSNGLAAVPGSCYSLWLLLHLRLCVQFRSILIMWEMGCETRHVSRRIGYRESFMIAEANQNLKA